MTDKYRAQAREARRAAARDRQCVGKRPYPTREAAEAVLGPSQYPYRCGVCDLWHVATDRDKRLRDRLAFVRRSR